MKLPRCSQQDYVSWRPVRKSFLWEWNAESGKKWRCSDSKCCLSSSTLPPWLDPGPLVQKPRNPPYREPLRKGETFAYNLGRAWRPQSVKKLESGRYPKGCSSGIRRCMKVYAAFSSQILPVSKWGREQMFTDGSGTLPSWCVSEISRVHWQGSIDGSIRQFLKPTSHQQLEEVALARHSPLHQQTVTCQRATLLTIHVKNQHLALV